MRKRFAEFYPPNADELDALWKRSLVVLDANVLLNVYRMRDATRDELLGTLEKNKDRIWVPYQFALEYHRNRLKVIAEQAGKYEAAAEHTKKLIAEFESDRVPFVTSASLEALRTLQGELEGQRDAAFALLHEDPHLGTLSMLLDGRVGDPPDAKLRSQMLEQARVRFHKGVPPGNRDAWKARRDLKTRRDEKQEAGDIKRAGRDAKSEEPKAKDSDARAVKVKTADAKTAETKTAEAKTPASAQNVADEASNVYGDCIGWLEILRVAQARKAPCLLLTDDRKEDWWQFQAGRRIGPLPALVREFRDRCGERFHMYLPSRFLEWSTERGLKIEDATIKELAELEQEQAGIKAESTEETFEMSRQKAQTSTDDKRERTGG